MKLHKFLLLSVSKSGSDRFPKVYIYYSSSGNMLGYDIRDMLQCHITEASHTLPVIFVRLAYSRKHSEALI